MTSGRKGESRSEIVGPDGGDRGDVNEPSIQIRVNGRPRSARAGQSVAELLEELEVDRRTVVVEVNREIVARNRVEEVKLEPDDEVEVVHFVGGG